MTANVIELPQPAGRVLTQSELVRERDGARLQLA